MHICIWSSTQVMRMMLMFNVHFVRRLSSRRRSHNNSFIRCYYELCVNPFNSYKCFFSIGLLWNSFQCLAAFTTMNAITLTFICANKKKAAYKEIMFAQLKNITGNMYAFILWIMCCFATTESFLFILFCRTVSLFLHLTVYMQLELLNQCCFSISH